MSHNLTPPLVSLVTPAYNQADYLAQTVASVLAQRYPALEYLVLDDGSTDHTAAVLAGFGERLRWETQVNIGQSRTLNKGWAIAQGEIVGYISSDDLLAPGAVADCVAALQADPGLVAVYCDFELIDGQGARIRTVQTSEYDERAMVEDLICFPGPGAFFRRGAFERVGGWNVELRQVPDFDFWLRLSPHGRFARVPRTLACYRIHNDSASFRSTTAELSDEIIRVVDELWVSQSLRLQAAGYSEPRSRAMAHLLAARSHFTSSRFARGIGSVLKAWRLAPSRLKDALAWRILIGGLMRRPVYLLRDAWKRVSR